MVRRNTVGTSEYKSLFSPQSSAPNNSSNNRTAASSSVSSTPPSAAMSKRGGAIACADAGEYAMPPPEARNSLGAAPTTTKRTPLGHKTKPVIQMLSLRSKRPLKQTERQVSSCGVPPQRQQQHIDVDLTTESDGGGGNDGHSETSSPKKNNPNEKASNQAPSLNIKPEPVASPPRHENDAPPPQDAPKATEVPKDSLASKKKDPPLSSPSASSSLASFPPDLSSPRKINASSTFLQQAAGTVCKFFGELSAKISGQQRSQVHDDNGKLLTERAKECWVCQVALEMPEADQICYYTRHVHPLIPSPPKPDKSSDNDDDEEKHSAIEEEDEGVTASTLAAAVCSVCALRLIENDGDIMVRCPSSSSSSGESAKDDKEQDKNIDVAPPEVCSLCLASEMDDEDDRFCTLLCDTCPRSTCESCVAACHGGGAAGHDALLQLKNSNDPWSCPICQPPARLHQYTPSSPPLAEESAEEVFDELCQLEAEHERCLAELEPEQREKQRQEIVLELQQTNEDCSEESVTDEMELWEKERWEHADRLQDTITRLQEVLERIHGLDLAEMYKNELRLSRYKSDPKAVEEATKELDKIDIEEKKLWDDEMERRQQAEARRFQEEQAEKKRLRAQGIEPPKSSKSFLEKELECYQDVEEITGDPALLMQRKPKTKGFESINRPPNIFEIQHSSMEMEDEVIRKNNIQITKVHEEDDDAVEIQNEKKRISRPCQGEFPMTVVEKKKRQAVKVLKRVTAKKRKVAAPSPAKEPKPRAQQAAAGLKDPPGVVTATLPAVKLSSSCVKAKAAPSQSTSSTTTTPLPVVTNKKRVVPLQPKAGNFSTSNIIASPKDTRIPHDFRSSTFKLPTRKGVKASVSRRHLKHLKSHQKEAIEFMWRNIYADYLPPQETDDGETKTADPGGCVIAHNMGLGKSFSAICLIETAIKCNHSKKVLLVVPVNTIENWKAEFHKWINKDADSGSMFLDVDDLSAASTDGQKRVTVNRWHKNRGVLLTSPQKLVTLLDPSPSKRKNPIVKDVQADKQMREALISTDLLVIDEAHLCVKTQTNKTARVLRMIETPRKVLLSGTPLQNNLMEYFCMIDYIRPGVLGESAAYFEREFVDRIVKGLPADASAEAAKTSKEVSKILSGMLEPYVDRKGASELAKVLPPMQQIVLHLRPSRLQTQLFRSFKKYQTQSDNKSFFTAFAAQKPIMNHPAALLYGKSKKTKSDDYNASSKKKKSDDDSDSLPEEDVRSVRKWWSEIEETLGDNAIHVEHGNKLIATYHILVEATRRNEKVLIFSQCLKTLDFLEDALNREEWLQETETLKGLLEGKRDQNFGGWRKDHEYVRIDGSVDRETRGTAISKFSDDDSVRAFLVSTLAGGVGINLVAASRVILFDTHFNPAVSEQAIFRTFRFGQKKRVFVYRFLTQGSMEEKVYARTVTKTGLSSRIVDKKNLESCFSSHEIADLQTSLEWAGCDRCGKWRGLIDDTDPDALPEKWYCEFNTDLENNSCDIPERSLLWYDLKLRRRGTTASNEAAGEEEALPQDNKGPSFSDEELAALEENDPILQHLLGVSVETGGRASKIISKHVFHDLLVKPKKEEETPQKKRGKSRAKASQNNRTPKKNAGKKSPSPAKATSPGINGKPPATPTRKRGAVKRALYKHDNDNAPSAKKQHKPSDSSSSREEGSIQQKSNLFSFQKNKGTPPSLARTATQKEGCSQLRKGSTESRSSAWGKRNSTGAESDNNSSHPSKKKRPSTDHEKPEATKQREVIDLLDSDDNDVDEQ